MKKDQNIPNKIITVTTVQENHFLITIMSLDNNHPTTIVDDLEIQRNSRNFSKNRYSRSNSQNN